MGAGLSRNGDIKYESQPSPHQVFSTIQITYGSVLAWALQGVPQPLDG
jgi:hypothetical protein